MDVIEKLVWISLGVSWILFVLYFAHMFIKMTREWDEIPPL